MPVVYLGLSLALVLFLLPTALRPPQPPPPTSAEFSPDEPPDPESIVSEFARASSATAGQGAPGVGDIGGGAGPGVGARPRGCPVGFGFPPRQTESIYSPACAPAFTGDNGGATAKNVTATEVRVAMWHTLGSNQTSYEGPVPNNPPSGNENAQDRTYRVLQAYFNRAFQLYGRTLRLYALKPGSGEASLREKAIKADVEYKVFAANILGIAASDEFARRKVVHFLGQQPLQYYMARQPYVWGWYIDATKAMQFGAEYLCKKLVGKPAIFAGDPLMHAQQRKFGLLFVNTEEFGPVDIELRRFLDRECGAKISESAGFNLGSDQQGYATAIARMRAAGVNNAIIVADFVSAAAITNIADSQGYSPEWFMPGTGALDFNQLGHLMNQNQWAHAFGFATTEMTRPFEQTDCYRAFKSIEPDTEPHYATCQYLFQSMHMLMAGIQNAGPRLTPETFTRGLRAVGYRFPVDPVWAIGGGFGPGDPTYMDNIVEFWWDATADDPDTAGGFNDAPGAYRYVRGGKRYKLGELPREDPLVFSDGVTHPEDTG